MVISNLIKYFLIILKLLNYWFLIIPSRLSFLAFLGYNLLIFLIFGEIDINNIRKDLGGKESTMYLLFMLFIGVPCFISFVSTFSVDTSSPGSRLNSSLDEAIAYRNGQMRITTPQKAFEIWKQTSHLDTIKTYENTELGKKVISGFDAEMRNAPPQKIYRKFVNDDTKERNN